MSPDKYGFSGNFRKSAREQVDELRKWAQANEKARIYLAGRCDELVDVLVNASMALERVTANFENAVANRPVRDMTETLAEVDAVQRRIRELKGVPRDG